MAHSIYTYYTVFVSSNTIAVDVLRISLTALVRWKCEKHSSKWMKNYNAWPEVTCNSKWTLNTGCLIKHHSMHERMWIMRGSLFHIRWGSRGGASFRATYASWASVVCLLWGQGMDEWDDAESYYLMAVSLILVFEKNGLSCWHYELKSNHQHCGALSLVSLVIYIKAQSQWAAKGLRFPYTLKLSGWSMEVGLVKISYANSWNICVKAYKATC